MEVMCLWLIFIGFIGSSLYAAYKKEKKQCAVWKDFADTHRLTFTEDNFFTKGTQVSGSYRGYYLQIEPLFEGKTTFTQLVLHRPPTEIKANRWLAETGAPRLTAADVTRMLAPKNLPGSVEMTGPGEHFAFKKKGIIGVDDLESISDLLVAAAKGYPAVLALGGEAMPALQTIATIPAHHGLQAVALQLMKEISQWTSFQFSYRLERLLCPRCFNRFVAHKAHIRGWRSVTYYGCRTCGQSQGFLEDDGRAMIILANQGDQIAFHHQGSSLIRNWFPEKRLFDFDEVHIIQATDEEVERFAVQIGNDTDPVRQPRYRQMRCTIAPDCQLSENSLRILQQTFGQVLRQPVRPTI